MKLSLIGRVAGVLALTMGLAACVDMTEELAVTSDTTAKATMTMTMGADIYAMMKSANTAETKPEDKFCAKEGEQLTENADGSATCVASSEGAFADLKFDEGDSKPVFSEFLALVMLRVTWSTSAGAPWMNWLTTNVRRPPTTTMLPTMTAATAAPLGSPKRSRKSTSGSSIAVTIVASSTGTTMTSRCETTQMTATRAPRMISSRHDQAAVLRTMGWTDASASGSSDNDFGDDRSNDPARPSGIPVA